ncbi:MAG: phosphoenolpyruvate--protein phosphotransferase [Eubacteriales bacterium]|nr:phosphoenolpyruvate--protein phosphotransferase [Eubacteriales bacterium]
MNILKGLPVSEGYAIGKVCILEKKDFTYEKKKINESQVENELDRFNIAKEKVKQNIDRLYQDTLKKISEDEAKIFESHKEVLEDPTLIDSVSDKIQNDLFSVEEALDKTKEEIVAKFNAIDDEYIKARVLDVKDITDQIMGNLLNIKKKNLKNLNKNTIIVSKDLTPSETMSMDLENVNAFLLEAGGRTSHTAILARSLEIPAIVGIDNILSKLKDDEEIIIDAKKGEVILDIDDNIKKEYEEKIEEEKREKKRLLSLKNEKAITKDGRTFRMLANIGNVSDVKDIEKYGAEGIGLFRTEFLYMDNTHFPTEEEQFETYKKVALVMKEKEFTIRTLDIGGDKELSYYKFDKEENPFLGYRAIRFCLDDENKNIFKAQLRAILRASHFGNIRIMFPMIINLEEIKKAKEILKECKNELKNEKIEYDTNIKIGIMIETPAASIMAEEFAKEVDFFSIGTNDLCQYTLAIDRGNAKMKNKYDFSNPAVLKSIKHIIEEARKANIECAMCGEAASDSNLTKTLVEYGLPEFSMCPNQIPKIKNIIRNI